MAKSRPAKKPSLEEAVSLLRRRYGGRLAPSLEGLAYRFTVWLPILASGRPVFSAEQRLILNEFFLDCFGGFSQTNVEGFPPWAGTWLPAPTAEPVVDHHILLIVYAIQKPEASQCMRQLKWLLQQKHIAAQDVVLIEQVPVHLLEAEKLVSE